MPQIFHRSTNTIARVSIFGAVFFIAGLLVLAAAISRSSWVTEAGVPREQPIQFSHERHVAGNGIDCRYCHTSVEDSAFAGIPPTKTCMNCHSQIFSGSPFLEPVRDSLRTDRSIEWTRVHAVNPARASDAPINFKNVLRATGSMIASTCDGNSLQRNS